MDRCKDPLFRIRELFTAYGEQVVHDRISFDIYNGELITIIGLNGQGKSLLIRKLSTRQIPTRGQIFFKGRDISDFSEDEVNSFKRGLGYVFQSSALFTTNFETGSYATALDNVAALLRLRDDTSSTERDILDRSIAALKTVGVREVDFNKYVRDLSGGTKKRISIAREIVCEPEVIFYDEPTAELDPPAKEQIAGLITKLGEEKINGRKRTSIVVTNDPLLSKIIKGRIGLLYNGQFYVYDSLADCISDRCNVAARVYFGHTCNFDT